MFSFIDVWVALKFGCWVEENFEVIKVKVEEIMIVGKLCNIE